MSKKSKKLKKLKVKQRNHLVAVVMRKAVQRHKNRKRQAKQTHQENTNE
jgi:hypothetical protein